LTRAKRELLSQAGEGKCEILSEPGVVQTNPKRMGQTKLPLECRDSIVVDRFVGGKFYSTRRKGEPLSSALREIQESIDTLLASYDCSRFSECKGQSPHFPENGEMYVGSEYTEPTIKMGEDEGNNLKPGRGGTRFAFCRIEKGREWAEWKKMGHLDT